jgi:hypothetical protein
MPPAACRRPAAPKSPQIESWHFSEAGPTQAQLYASDMSRIDFVAAFSTTAVLLNVFHEFDCVHFASLRMHAAMIT